MDRIEIRTRFTDYPTTNHVITLDTFATPANLEKLRCVFYEPDRLKPEKTIEKITGEAAEKLAELAPIMRGRLTDSTKVAHFLDRLIFCMFAESVGLLPNHVFNQFLHKTNRDPRFVNRDITRLFEAMAKGGDFYGETIPHFNGNLFDNTTPLDLLGTELPILIEASAFDWSEMDPSIFGTLLRARDGPCPTLSTRGALHWLSGHRHSGRTCRHGTVTPRMDRGAGEDCFPGPRRH